MFAEKEHLVTIDSFHGTEKFKTMISCQTSQGRNTIAVSVQSFYDISDQRETVVCRLCCSLLTVKDM